MCRSSPEPGTDRRELANLKSKKVRRVNQPFTDERGALTLPVEILSGVPARQSEGQRNGPEQLHDVSDVI